MFDRVKEVLGLEPKPRSVLDDLVEKVAEGAHISKRKAFYSLGSYACNLDYSLSASRIKRASDVHEDAIQIKTKADRVIPAPVSSREDYIRGIGVEAKLTYEQAKNALNAIETTINKILDRELKNKGTVVIHPIGTYVYKNGNEYFIPPGGLAIDEKPI